MKKVFVIIVAAALLLALVPGSVVVAATGEIVDFIKTFDMDSAGLCDNVTGIINITVDEGDLPVTVTDTIPECMTLGGVSVSPSADTTLVVDGNDITVTIDEPGTYIISFWAQVTHVNAYGEAMNVTNTAYAIDSGEEEDEDTAEASDWIMIEPYTDFEKYIGEGPDEIVVGADQEFVLYVDIYNDLDIDMEDAYVKDNLPGNVAYVDWVVSTGTVYDEKVTGKAEKAHLIWDIGTIEPEDAPGSDLTVNTDMWPNEGKDGNPKSGKYMKAGPGTYTLNPGATLIFTAEDTGFECSVRSDSVKVDVIPAVS